MSEANILSGKRRRAAVDYRKLNGELFGDSGGAELDDEVVWRPGMSNKVSARALNLPC